MRTVFLVCLLCTLLVGFGAPSPGAVELLHVQHFSLEQPYSYQWKSPARDIRDGTIFVVAVHPADARVRQTGGAVLYVGDTPAERANNGDLDGRVIGFVPGRMDLSRVPVFWGPATLPERVDAVAGAEALAQAPAWAPRPVAPLPAVALADAEALYGLLGDLLAEHAPNESGQRPRQESP